MASEFKINVVIGGVEQTVSTIGEIEAALAATKAELKNVEVGGEAFNKLGSQAANLQRELQNSYKEVVNFDRSIGQLSESVSRIGSSVTAAFTIATSAFSLLGAESEDLSQAQVKAQQALALALSATTIATNAKKLSEDLSNISQALGIGLTEQKVVATNQETTAEVANTAATVANTAATGAQAAATGAATVAQEGLNVAMKANPIGIIITAVTALVGVMAILSSNTDDASEEFKKFKEESDKAAESINQSLFQEVSNIVTKYNELGNAIREANDAGSKQIWLKEAVKILPELSQLTGKELENQDKILGALQARANLEEGFAKREATLKRIAQLEAEYVEANAKNAVIDKERAQLIDIEVRVARSKLRDIEDQIVAQKNFNNALVEQNRLAKEADEAAKKAADEAKRRSEEAARKRAADRENAKKEAQQTVNDLQKIEDDFNQKRKDAALKTEEEKLTSQRDLEIEKINKIETEKVALAKKYGLDTTKITKEAEEARDSVRKFYQEEDGRRKEAAVKEEQKRLEALNLEYKILQSEISFGDSNTTDNFLSQQERRKQITLDQINFEIEQNKRTLLVEDELGKLKLFKYQELLNKQKEAQLELLNVQEQQALLFAQAESDKSIQQTKSRLEQENKVELELIDGQYRIKGKKAEEYSAVELQVVKNANQQKQNEANDLALKEGEIRDTFNLKRKQLEKQTEDEIFNYKVQKLQEFVQVYSNISSSISQLISSISELNRVENENQLNDLRDANATKLNEINTQYNAERQALDEQLNNGVLSREAYNAAVLNLDKKLKDSTEAQNTKARDAEKAAKKKAFEDDKKLKTAQAIIAGIQGALQAFTGAMQLGPIAGPIVGGILAALVVATTGIQVAAIQRTKFDEGAPTITAPNTGGAVDTGAAAITQASTGGMTQFNQSLVGTPTGTGAQASPFTNQLQRVYVLESDITNTQNRVSVLESNSSFG